MKIINMYNHNPLELLRKSINELIDQIKLQSQHNTIQDKRIENHDLEIQEMKENQELILSKIEKFEYLIDRNQELELRENPYSFDGTPNCNS